MAKLTREGRRYIDFLWRNGDFLPDKTIADRIGALTGYKPSVSEISAYRLTKDEPLLRPGERLGCIGNVFYYGRRVFKYLFGREDVRGKDRFLRMADEGHAEEEY